MPSSPEVGVLGCSITATNLTPQLPDVSAIHAAVLFPTIGRKGMIHVQHASRH